MEGARVGNGFFSFAHGSRTAPRSRTPSPRGFSAGGVLIGRSGTFKCCKTVGLLRCVLRRVAFSEGTVRAVLAHCTLLPVAFDSWTAEIDVLVPWLALQTPWHMVLRRASARHLRRAALLSEAWRS